MSKNISMVVLTAAVAFAGCSEFAFGKEDLAKSIDKSIARRSKEEGAKLDPLLVRRSEAIINTKRLLDTKLFSTNVVDEATGETVKKEYVQYHYRQAGVEWYELKERREISGVVGPRRYSKLKLLYAAEAAGKSGQLKAALSSKETANGLTYWDLFMAAMYLREDDENLMAGIQLAVESGLCTQEQLDAILEASID